MEMSVSDWIMCHISCTQVKSNVILDHISLSFWQKALWKIENFVKIGQKVSNVWGKLKKIKASCFRETQEILSKFVGIIIMLQVTSIEEQIHGGLVKGYPEIV